MQFRIDDGSGLRVADAKFLGESKFEWDLFDGYDAIRILTYSAGISAIVRLLDKHDFSNFECVFGSEKTLHSIKDIIAFQQIAVSDSRAAIQGLKDERHIYILSKIRKGQAHFRVLQKGIAHSKIYLLENTATGDTRVIIGSANLSESAFSGRQLETLVKFDNESDAWLHYSRMYDDIRNNASEEIELPDERIIKADIEITEAPILNPSDHSTLVIDSSTSPHPLADTV
ncbi:MAG: NgoFVII family restriction endonuclease, partial [Chloroflexi bacterium]|nr:NgoFVII family restriction endonuclease [Chloroflexota bacterium]